MSLSLGTSLLCRMNVRGGGEGDVGSHPEWPPAQISLWAGWGQGFEATAWEEPLSLCDPHPWAFP